MASTRSTLGAIEEIAGFLASGPFPDELLGFRPSPCREVVPLTPIGRLTEYLLQFNQPALSE